MTEDKAEVVSLEEVMQKSVEDTAKKVVEVAHDYQKKTVLYWHHIGSYISNAIEDNSTISDHYIHGGNKFFSALADKVQELTGSESVSARTLRYWTNMSRVMEEDEVKNLSEDPQFSYSKLRAVLDHFGVCSRNTRDGGDEEVKKLKKKALKFLDKNINLTVRELTDKLKGLEDRSGSSSASTGESAGGSGSDDDVMTYSDMFSIPGKVSKASNGTIDHCTSLLLVLQDENITFDTPKKRENFVSKVEEANDSLAELSEAVEEVTKVISEFLKSVEDESSSEDIAEAVSKAQRTIDSAARSYSRNSSKESGS